MKRCPSCNQTFSDEWLSFCTDDGTALVEAEASPSEVRPTANIAPPRPTASAAEQPTLYMSNSYTPPPMQYTQPAPVQPGWRAPLPLAYASAGPQQSLAVTSLILGIVSITIGWCYIGILTGPIAVGLGIYSLIQIKNKPTQYGGKPLAITGIVTGGIYLVVVALLILIYGLAFIVGLLANVK